MSDLHGKKVLITGASSGIGAATAREFARRGAHVVLHGRNRAGLEETANQCQAEGLTPEQIFLTVGDVTKEEDIRRIAAETVAQCQTIHILVNNAGSGSYGGLINLNLPNLDEKYAQFVRAPCLLTHLLLPELIKNKGCVINVSSALSHVPVSEGLPYTIMKAALDELTRCMALELATKGIRVNSVNPGLVHTNYHSRWMGDEERARQMTSAFAQGHALRRGAQPVEVAKAIIYLASEDAAFITGTNLLIDGGLTLSPPVMGDLK